MTGKTDFGFEKVTPDEKTRRVGEVFTTVAGRYDVMNDLMSLGSHRLMKRIAVDTTGLRAGDHALDLAGGTGDMAALLSPVVGATGRVIMADINPSMLAIGRDRLLDAGCANVGIVTADAEALPFAGERFDAITIAFGLRNLTDKERGLREMHRVLRPGGRLVVLEFSKPKSELLGTAYETFQALWPAMGQLVAGNAAPYRYLVESIRMHPNQAALRLMLEDAGFARVSVDNLAGGIVAIHRGVK